MDLEEHKPSKATVRDECYTYSLSYIHGDLDFKDFIDSYKSIMSP